MISSVLSDRVELNYIRKSCRGLYLGVLLFFSKNILRGEKSVIAIAKLYLVRIGMYADFLCLFK